MFRTKGAFIGDLRAMSKINITHETCLTVLPDNTVELISCDFY